MVQPSVFHKGDYFREKLNNWGYQTVQEFDAFSFLDTIPDSDRQTDQWQSLTHCDSTYRR